MSNLTTKVRWAPRVRMDKLYRLYQTDARGIYDEELIDEVGFALAARCRSIIAVTESVAGRVYCPQCATLIVQPPQAEEEVLRCPRCGWETTWAAFHQSWRHQELFAAGALDLFQRFVERWPQAGTPQEKMLLIDWVIHRWHWEEREDHLTGRPTGVNLIEGNRKQVLALLDQLSNGRRPAQETGAS